MCESGRSQDCAFPVGSSTRNPTWSAPTHTLLWTEPPVAPLSLESCTAAQRTAGTRCLVPTSCFVGGTQCEAPRDAGTWIFAAPPVVAGAIATGAVARRCPVFRTSSLSGFINNNCNNKGHAASTLHHIYFSLPTSSAVTGVPPEA